MTLVIIALGVLMVIIILGSSNDQNSISAKRPMKRAIRPEYSRKRVTIPHHTTHIEKSPEKVSVQQKFRRIQQSLARQRFRVSQNMREMANQSQVMDVSSQLLDVRSQHIALQNAMIGLNQKEIDILTAQNEVEFTKRESSLALSSKLHDLRVVADKLELSKAQVQIDNQNVHLERSKNDVLKTQHFNQLNWKKIELEKLGLKNIEDLLSNKEKSIDITKQRVEVFRDKSLNKIEVESINNKRDALKNLYKGLENKEASIRLAKRDLEISFRESSEVFKMLLNRVLVESWKLNLQKRENTLSNEQEKLLLKETRVKHLEKHVSEMYKIKSEWLRIENKNNHLAFREQKLQLDDQYVKTTHILEQLRLYRYENNLLNRESKLELKQLISTLQKSWLL